MEIYVLDRDINILGVFSTYDAIIWNPKLHEPGKFKASFIFSAEMNRILQRGNLIYKTDEEESTAIITKKDLQLNKYGEETIQVQGYMASRYLNQRIIWKKMILKGTPEQIMRQMVYEQAVNPSDPTRKMNRIQLGDLHGYAGETEKQVTYDNLQEALTALSKTSELGYRLNLNIEEKIFYFDIYQGVNRIVGTSEPCIFTRDFGNVYTQEYSEDDSNYKNICLVGGGGEDEERILTTVGDAEGFDRYEMFCNAAGMSDKDITADEYIQQLQQKGKEKLASYYVAKAFESKINKEKAMQFALGDYVTCTDAKWNVKVNTQIKEIQKGYSKTERSCVVTFGDSVPTLIDLIKRRSE